jgi:hypothetical protein
MYRGTRQVLVAQHTDGSREDLARLGIWSEKPDAIEPRCWRLNQAEHA